jgi:hypothetical protein
LPEGRSAAVAAADDDDDGDDAEGAHELLLASCRSRIRTLPIGNRPLSRRRFRPTPFGVADGM